MTSKIHRMYSLPLFPDRNRLFVRAVVIPGWIDYDGGLPGVSVSIRRLPSRVWVPYFITAKSADEFCQWLTAHQWAPEDGAEILPPTVSVFERLGYAVDTLLAKVELAGVRDG